MADPDIDDMREIAASLAASTRELNDAASRIAEAMPAQANSSNITIQAGGIANAIAVCVSASTVVLFVVFASVMAWMYAQERGTREAWSDVHRAGQAQIRAEWEQFKQEHSNAGR